MRILRMATGMLVIAMSLWCFLNQGVAFLALAFVIGIVMILQGASGLVIYTKFAHNSEHYRTIFLESLLAFIFGIVVLTNQVSTEAAIPIFFGMWLTTTGTIKITDSMYIEADEEKYWIWNLGLGIVSALVGVYCFYNMIAADLPTIVLVAMVFLIEGMCIVLDGIALPKRRTAPITLITRQRELKKRRSKVAKAEKKTAKTIE